MAEVDEVGRGGKTQAWRSAGGEISTVRNGKGWRCLAGFVHFLLIHPMAKYIPFIDERITIIVSCPSLLCSLTEIVWGNIVPFQQQIGCHDGSSNTCCIVEVLVCPRNGVIIV